MLEEETFGLILKTEKVTMVLVISTSCDILKNTTLSDGVILFVLSIVVAHLIHCASLLVQLYLVLRWPIIFFVYWWYFIRGVIFPAIQYPLFSIDTVVFGDLVALPGGVSVFMIGIYSSGIRYQFKNVWPW